MVKAQIIASLRKRWYILLAVAAIAAVAYGIYAYDLNPQTLLEEHGYNIILVWTFFEGETIVILAGMLAEKFHLDPWLIALHAFCGSFLSDQLMFCLGKYAGKPILRYFPRIESNMGKAVRLFEKYNTILILGFRFVYGVRNVTPILLGISGVRQIKFFFLNAIGAAIWALSFSFGGFYAGKAFMRIMGTIGHGVLYAMLLALGAVGLICYIRSKRAVKTAQNIALHAEKGATDDV